MYRFLVFASLLFYVPLLSAAPLTEARPKSARMSAAEAEVFAQSMLDLIQQVAHQFIRVDAPAGHTSPGVSEQELTAAVLDGLYETARRPLPSTLVRKARTATDAIVLHRLLRDARLELGDFKELRGSAAVMAGARGITRILDSVSVIIPAQEVLRSGYNEVDQNPGLDVILDSRPMLVRQVFPGGPAQRAGLLPGDRILSANCGTVLPPLGPASMTANAVLPTAMYPGQPMILTVERPETHETRTVRLQCTRFRPETVLGVQRHDDNSWSYWVDRPNGVAHVRIATLVQGTADELAQVLTQLQSEGLRGLILDLRWCPGGVPDQIAALARLFLSEGVIMILQDHNEERTARATEPAPFANLPLVVLVNGETMGGAELLAAALQDNHRAKIVGQRTFGKATMQRLLVLPEAAYLKVTSGTLVRASGKNLQRHPYSKASDDWGVKPDDGLEFRLSPPLTERLKKEWLRQTLRPGGSHEALPLDDPANDPQRQAAVKTLLRQFNQEPQTAARR